MGWFRKKKTDSTSGTYDFPDYNIPNYSPGYAPSTFTNSSNPFSDSGYDSPYSPSNIPSRPSNAIGYPSFVFNSPSYPQPQQMQFYSPPESDASSVAPSSYSLGSHYSGKPSKYSFDAASTTSSMRSRRERAFNKADRAANGTLLVGTTMTAFGPLDPTGVTLITGAATAGVGAAMKMAVYVCRKCNITFEKVKDRMKHRMDLCDGCLNCS